MIAWLRSPAAVIATLLVLITGWALASGAQARRALAQAGQALAIATAERDAALAQRDTAQAANTLWHLTDQRRRAEAALAAAARARLLAAQQQRMQALAAEKAEADAALRRFIEQFRRAPDACTQAAARMEAACPTLADY